ncbi:MAG: ribonuclease HI family protein [Candidatus Caldatribacterium sp.]|uniref:ribonuclease HI family protein n=1 Tax=Candidatus Caldatribacterium sp. TaxID=2282143 RepID=UPI00299267BF|nr:ribonuclease HI family protein [Candidatus Caldatribacterium sp.]MCX7731459.1 ribonuclease HI family protein [Candidatus Caldatribacterium sp.]MDW8080623.1 ribonuclease HI family protein [Candidatus Calescibacterium sp.]
MGDFSIERFRECFVFIDGASKGNPGESAVAFVVCDPEGNILFEMASRIGIATNNEAEYWALIFALDFLKQWKVERLTILSDSELVVRQMRGTYKVRAGRLLPLHSLAKERMQEFPACTLVHVPREKNVRADSLASEILTSRIKL